MSALPPIADIRQCRWDVRKVPIAEVLLRGTDDSSEWCVEEPGVRQGYLGYTRRVGIGSRGPAGCFSRPGEEHRAGSGYVRDKNVQPRMAEFLIHEQQREPKLAAGVVDTSRATAGVRNFLYFRHTGEVTLTLGQE